jgi:hypothetical protein
MTIVFVGAFAVSASAQNIPLLNADIETNSSPLFGAIDNWEPNGGWADHASFARPNNGTLGLNFGFYSAGATETVGQITSAVFRPDTEYVFTSWAYPGGNDVGTVPYQIGYENLAGEFVELATAAYDITAQGEWLEQPGVAYMTRATGDEIGMPVWVRLGDETAGGADDIWFDNFSLTPEPSTLGLLAVAVLALRRRR